LRLQPEIRFYTSCNVPLLSLAVVQVVVMDLSYKHSPEVLHNKQSRLVSKTA
jgi:hypothetical protein